MNQLGLKALSLLLVTVFAPQSEALDLKSFKTPIHYECRNVLAGGIWVDEKTGVFRSGAVQTAPHDTFRMVVERLMSTKGQRLKRCQEEKSQTGGYKLEEREFCLTKIYQGRGSNFELTHYCEITGESALANTNHSLQCYLARIYLDTDKRFGVSTDSLDAIAMNLPFPTTVNKFDCQRLDR
jgi:hypothetical protein